MYGPHLISICKTSTPKRFHLVFEDAEEGVKSNYQHISRNEIVCHSIPRPDGPFHPFGSNYILQAIPF